MTEAEWLACDHPSGMLTYLRSRTMIRSTSVRKLRLITCACCRRIWEHLDQPRREAVEVAELYADRLASAKQLSAAHTRTLRGGRPRHDWNPAGRAAAPTRSLRSEVEGCVMGCLIPSLPLLLEEATVQCALLRCILGNPFHTIELDPGCRTPGVISLAQAAYEERDLPRGEMQLDRLAILADALEDAGCTDADILEHLRMPGPHVRGCWPVDLVLGKQ